MPRMRNAGKIMNRKIPTYGGWCELSAAVMNKSRTPMIAAIAMIIPKRLVKFRNREGLGASDPSVLSDVILISSVGVRFLLVDAGTIADSPLIPSTSAQWSARLQ